MISTMQPTETSLIKQEQNSPNSLSNISSPNTATNFSPHNHHQQQQQQRLSQQQAQQQQQRQQQASEQLNGTGATPMSSSTESGASAASHGMFSYYGAGVGNGGNGASPPEASTASDPGGMINTTCGGASTHNVNAMKPTASTALDDEFGSCGAGVNGVNSGGMYTNGTDLNAPCIGGGNGGSNDSAMNPGSVSATAMSAASSVSSASMNGANNNGLNNYFAGGMYFNPSDSPTKQQQQFLHFQQQQKLQQMHILEQQQHQLQLQQQQQHQQQQKFFSMSGPSCSTTPTPGLGGGMASDGMSPLSYPMSSGGTTYASMPQSAPSSAQRVRNPFEEEDDEELLYKQGTSSGRSYSANPISGGSGVMPSPTFLDCYREAFHQRSVKLPSGPLQTQQDFNLTMHRNRLAYPFSAQQKRQLPVPYPPGSGVPNLAAPMPMLVRMPPHMVMMGPGGPVGGIIPPVHKMPMILGPNNIPGNVYQMSNGFVFCTHNNQMILLGNSSVGQTLFAQQMAVTKQTMLYMEQQQKLQQQQQQQHQQQQQSTTATAASTTSAPPKKEKKKKEKESKKQQQQQQQQESAAAAVAASCSMVNGSMMDPNVLACNNFSPGSKQQQQQRIAAMQQQHAQHPALMSFGPGPFSPSHFSGPGANFGHFPSKLSSKLLCPLPQLRFAAEGDCALCRQKVVRGKIGIRCTAFGQGCRQLFHQECSGLSPDAFDGLYGDSRLEWVCRNCQHCRQLLYAV